MKKVLSLLLLVVISTLFVFKTTAFAQSPTAETSQNQYISPNTNPDVPKNQKIWVQSIMIETMAAASCQLAGFDPTTKDHKCLGVDPTTGKLSYVAPNGGLLSFTGNMIAQMYNIPVSSSDYVRYMAANFGLAKPSYAADPAKTGYGFSTLSPLTGIWSVFRNLVYVVFVIVFLLIGIAIMLRVKIDPRTVMTIQNQIPKIIIGILLVTFSFAIAGLLIDLMYIISYVILGVFSQASTTVGADSITNLVRSTNPFDALNQITNVPDIAGQSANAVGGHLGAFFENDQGRIFVGLVGGIFGAILGGSAGIPVVGALAGGIIGAVAGNIFISQILSLIAFIIIIVALIGALFRLWIQLLLAYVSILIDIIFAPLWILAGLIPGSKASFSTWIRDLAANLAAFPAVMAMFLLATILKDAFSSSASENNFAPPLIGNPATGDQIGAIIALGIILMTPNIVKMMKQIFGAPNLPLGAAGDALKPGIGFASAVGGAVWGSLYSTHRNQQTGQLERHGPLGGIVQKGVNTIRRRTLGGATAEHDEQPTWLERGGQRVRNSNTRGARILRGVESAVNPTRWGGRGNNPPPNPDDTNPTSGGSGGTSGPTRP